MAKRPDKTTVSIPLDIKRQARAKAILEGTSLSAVITKLLEMWLVDEIELKN